HHTLHSLLAGWLAPSLAPQRPFPLGADGVGGLDTDLIYARHVQRRWPKKFDKAGCGRPPLFFLFVFHRQATSASPKTLFAGREKRHAATSFWASFIFAFTTTLIASSILSLAYRIAVGRSSSGNVWV